MLTVDDARCVHRLAARASCAACVRACPQGAWRSDADSLAFDAARCDGCGLCLGACPTGALALGEADTDPPLQRGADGGHRLALACSRAPGIDATRAGSDPAVLPCLHAIDEDRLLRWQAAGVTRIALLTGDCPSCPRGRRLDAAQTLPGRLALLSALVPARSALPTVERLAAWAAAPAALRPSGAGAQPGRRALLGFGRARVPATASAAPPAQPAVPPRLRAAQRLQALGAVSSRWGVTLQPTRCDACAACARLCPSGAIALIGPAAVPTALRWTMGACIGCGLCVDVCTPGAIRRAAPGGQPAAERRLKLTAVKCPGCGKAYRAVQAAADPSAQSAPFAVSPSLASPACPACRSGSAHRGHRVVQAGCPAERPDGGAAALDLVNPGDDRLAPP